MTGDEGRWAMGPVALQDATSDGLETAVKPERRSGLTGHTTDERETNDVRKHDQQRLFRVHEIITTTPREQRSGGLKSLKKTERWRKTFTYIGQRT